MLAQSLNAIGHEITTADPDLSGSVQTRWNKTLLLSLVVPSCAASQRKGTKALLLPAKARTTVAFACLSNEEKASLGLEQPQG
jgi:hypothetical protein